MAKKYWLMKSEPDVFSIDDLKKKKKSLWDGVRNYQARNFMMQDMQIGDEILFYHSNAEPPGVAGLAKVSAEAVPDPTQFDPQSEYFDAKASPDKPRWYCVEVAFEKAFSQLIPLEQIKSDPKLKNMLVIRPGQRLSVQPVDKADFDHILKLAKLK